jgi:hypothetical protein
MLASQKLATSSKLLLKEANMLKLNKLVIAMATAFAATSAFAAPVTPTDIQNAGANLQQAWITGASAPTYNVFLGFASKCQDNTLSVFHAGTATGSVRPGSSSAGNHLAYACVIAGKTTVLYFTNQGGSVNAFSPHVASSLTGGTVVTNLNRLQNVAAATCAPSATLAVTAAHQPAAQIYKCTGATVNGFAVTDNTPKKPVGGFSDVEPALFGIDVTGKGTVVNTGVTQVFGVLASDKLYRALQAQQNIAESSTFLPQNAPNITRAQYAALISDASSATWKPLLPNDADAEVIIARRVDTSGTQASSNAFFLGNPCNGNPSTGGALNPATAADSAEGIYTVIEGAETGNVRDALIAANAANKYALGVVSLENATVAGYHYVKLDGVHPETGAAANTTDAFARYTSAQGNYGFQIDLKAFKASSATGFGATVIDEILSGFNTVACSDVPRGLLLNNSTSACGGTANEGVVVSKVTRQGNNCRPLTSKF